MSALIHSSTAPLGDLVLQLSGGAVGVSVARYSTLSFISPGGRRPR
jgi:hypothetical protein